MNPQTHVEVGLAVELLEGQQGLLLDALTEVRSASMVLSRLLRRDRKKYTLAALAAEAEIMVGELEAEQKDLIELLSQVEAGEVADDLVSSWEQRHAAAKAGGPAFARQRFHAGRIQRVAKVVRGLFAALSAGDRLTKAATERAEKAEAEARHLGQKLVAADAVIQKLKGHLALLDHTPDGKPYPIPLPMAMPDLPRTWERTENGCAARCDHQDDDAENGSPRGEMALARVGDRIRLTFTYEMADVPEGGDWAQEHVERMARRVALVGQRNSPEGCVFRSPSGEPGVRLSPLVARLLAARVLQLRATTPSIGQEGKIAEQLGLMSAEESMADALARWRAATPAPSAA